LRTDGADLAVCGCLALILAGSCRRIY